MQYLLMIYQNEKGEQFKEDKMQEIYRGYNTFNQHVLERKALESGHSLMPTSSATTVRVRDGQTLITDGPFAETKEQISGYYLLNCKDLDDAIELATQIPTVAYGSIEIRPIRSL